MGMDKFMLTVREFKTPLPITDRSGKQVCQDVGRFELYKLTWTYIENRRRVCSKHIWYI